MRIRIAVPDAHLGPGPIDAALEAVTRANENMIASGVVPTSDEAIASGVKWRPEPPGDEHFDVASTVMVRGHGDCDDLAPWAAATRRVTGEDPGAFARVVQSGPNRYHAIVQRSDGSIEDPSAEAGMYDYRPPVQPHFASRHNGPHVRHQVVGGEYHVARCDVPWVGSQYAVCGHGFGETYAEAVSEAVQGVSIVGESAGIINPQDALKLRALYALLAEADPAEVAELLGHQGLRGASAVVGSLFGSLLKTATSLAPIPGAGLIANMIPESPEKMFGGGGGGGHPAAPPAGAATVMPGGHGGGFGGGGYGGVPVVPVIVRF